MATKVGTDGARMNALAFDTRQMTRRLEDIEKRRGLTREQARSDLARKMGVSPGTLRSIAQGRIKNPLSLEGIKARARQLIIANLEREIVRLTHERDLLLATGADPRSDAMAQAEAGIKQAKEALNGSVK